MNNFYKLLKEAEAQWGLYYEHEVWGIRVKNYFQKKKKNRFFTNENSKILNTKYRNTFSYRNSQDFSSHGARWTFFLNTIRETQIFLDVSRSAYVH